LFEAMASGVPSIVSRNCGASELLVPERDFLVIDAFSVEQIKEAILRLYESRELRERLETNGPVAIAALQQDGVAKPYEEGVDRLIQVVGAARRVKSAA
jgi:glycosyltransferase involved in cell wall biosynthesis